MAASAGARLVLWVASGVLPRASSIRDAFDPDAILASLPSQPWDPLQEMPQTRTRARSLPALVETRSLSPPLGEDDDDVAIWHMHVSDFGEPIDWVEGRGLNGLPNLENGALLLLKGLGVFLTIDGYRPTEGVKVEDFLTSHEDERSMCDGYERGIRYQWILVKIGSQSIQSLEDVKLALQSPGSRTGTIQVTWKKAETVYGRLGKGPNDHGGRKEAQRKERQEATKESWAGLVDLDTEEDVDQLQAMESAYRNVRINDLVYQKLLRLLAVLMPENPDRAAKLRALKAAVDRRMWKSLAKLIARHGKDVYLVTKPNEWQDEDSEHPEFLRWRHTREQDAYTTAKPRVSRGVVASRGAFWGQTVRGKSGGDGWVVVITDQGWDTTTKPVYLPVESQGATVLVKQDRLCLTEADLKPFREALANKDAIVQLQRVETALKEEKKDSKRSTKAVDLKESPLLIAIKRLYQVLTVFFNVDVAVLQVALNFEALDGLLSEAEKALRKKNRGDYAKLEEWRAALLDARFDVAPTETDTGKASRKERKNAKAGLKNELLAKLQASAVVVAS